MVAKEHIRVVREAIVAREVASTQDTAWGSCGGNPGVLVVAEVQSAGRGRLGRSWVQAPGMGLACTFAISTDTIPPERLSLVAGVAIARAIETAADVPLVGLRWPNDVVERGGVGRKLAGVLIERRGNIALVGIGINIAHRATDFPEALRTRAMSIAMLKGRGSVDRLEVLLSLVRALDRRVVGPAATVMSEWKRRDVLMGTRQTFLHDGRAVSGRVVALDPLHLITVATDAGERVQLPALSTSLVHE